ncbi:23S rRNA (adenine(1618)-N(6))-methyltransferase RlmF [Brumimicrobium aurantiacum]|uniref:Ribosomal RNA large subunit methyltransferase F n=2 Tax=Brumimicrobium aurantiacum TaxID=1737063 RepID=A0A3E1EYU2_9FLAO|nr:23S rRNA (adenine(1618)-N(6))-methyltransferase RlmF [Brumimicrobium aurantiacum]
MTMTKDKSRLHPRNKNKGKYDLNALAKINRDLKGIIQPNKYGEDSIDFSDPRSVKILNQTLLEYYYKIDYWEFPDNNLTPPIPGRADYIHYVADLLAKDNKGKIPKGNAIKCLDIGVGASCIYPILGATEYGWNFIGSDVDPKSITSSENIVNNNPSLTGKIELRLQKSPKQIFLGVIKPDDQIDVTICNPPFHSSKEEALKGTRRKVKNLTGKNAKSPKLNFAGNQNELIFKGGEYVFIHTMIKESKAFAKNVNWFTTLVSKQSNMKGILNALEKIGAKEVKEIPMGTGNKITRVVAWRF